MTAGAYGYSTYAANHTKGEDDRIPAFVADYLFHLAKTAGKIMVSSDTALTIIEKSRAGDSVSEIARVLDLGLDIVESVLVNAQKFWEAGQRAGAVWDNGKEFLIDAWGGRVVNKRSSPIGTNAGIPDAKHTKGLGYDQSIPSTEQRQLAVKMNLGKSLNSRMIQDKSISNMLKKASGVSSSLFEFSGYMACAQGKRSTTFMCFRHNIGSDSTPDAYSTLSGMNILHPVAGSQDLPGAATGTANQPYHYHKDLSTWFHPMGRSKFEDTAWNMNRLKFMTGEVNPSDNQPLGGWSPDANVDLPVQKDVTFAGDTYRRTSAIYENNNYATVNTIGNGTSPRQFNDYNMVFNRGRIQYEFANKGDGPVSATIIVYKVKRQNTTLSSHIADYDNDSPNEQNGQRGIPKALHGPLEDGIKESYRSLPGYGDIGGNSDPTADWNTHPGKPLYPITSRVKQSNLPFREESRVNFILNSGGRRSVELALGGDLYDPVNVVQKNANHAHPVPLLDSHSFIVCLSIHGTKMTRIYGSDDRLGDIYSVGRIEWQARYEENIGAAMFKDGNTRSRMNGRSYRFPGSGSTTTNLTGAAETAAMLMPIAGATRTVDAGASLPVSDKK